MRQSYSNSALDDRLAFVGTILFVACLPTKARVRIPSKLLCICVTGATLSIIGKSFSRVTGKVITSVAKMDRLDHRLREAERRANKVVPANGPNIVSIPVVEFGDAAKRMLAALRPMTPIGRAFVRKGQESDGGYVMVDHGLHNVPAYSLGINQDVTWDLSMAALGCDIFQYDHTIDKLPEENERFHWQKLGIAPQSDAAMSMASIGDLIERNGHTGSNDLILKMDIEDAEWDVFAGMANETLLQFSQIVAEFHKLGTADYRHPSTDVATLHRRAKVFEKINQTHQCVHVHANNWRSLGIIGGVMLPDVVEVTYVRRSDHAFEPCRTTFPTALDSPCNVNAPDFYLGPLGYDPSVQ